MITSPLRVAKTPLRARFKAGNAFCIESEEADVLDKSTVDKESSSNNRFILYLHNQLNVYINNDQVNNKINELIHLLNNNTNTSPKGLPFSISTLNNNDSGQSTVTTTPCKQIQFEEGLSDVSDVTMEIVEYKHQHNEHDDEDDDDDEINMSKIFSSPSVTHHKQKQCVSKQGRVDLVLQDRVAFLMQEEIANMKRIKELQKITHISSSKLKELELEVIYWQTQTLTHDIQAVQRGMWVIKHHHNKSNGTGIRWLQLSSDGTKIIWSKQCIKGLEHSRTQSYVAVNDINTVQFQQSIGSRSQYKLQFITDEREYEFTMLSSTETEIWIHSLQSMGKTLHDVDSKVSFTSDNHNNDILA